jgi:hypothetical protein
VKRLEQVSNRFSALKTRKEVLALLQSAKTSSTATRRFTSGYFLAARSAQSLNFQTASKTNGFSQIKEKNQSSLLL